MRRINLLPPEERRRPAERLRGGAPAILLIVGATALIFMVGVYLFFLLRLNAVEDEIAGLDQQIADQNARLAELEPYRDLQAQLDAKKPVADGIYRYPVPVGPVPARPRLRHPGEHGARYLHRRGGSCKPRGAARAASRTPRRDHLHRHSPAPLPERG